jgi:hypothetical protein
MVDLESRSSNNCRIMVEQEEELAQARRRGRKQPAADAGHRKLVAKGGQWKYISIERYLMSA